MTLSIVVLNYKTKELTISCLTSLFNLFKEELEDNVLEILAVDNASGDGSYEALLELSKNKKGIKVIKSEKNLGFGGGNNLGVKNSKGDFILFLNSDTEVLDKGFLKMTEFLNKNPKVGILGPKLINFDGTDQPSAGNFYGLSNLLIMLLGLEKRRSPKKIEKVDWISGAAAMVRKKVFERIGRFDEKIFIYAEDMELCFRAKILGFDTYFFPGASVKHVERGSSDRTFAIVNIYKNILYFYKKHKSYLEYVIAKFLLISKAVAVYSLGKILRNRYYVDTYSKAIKAIV